MSTGQDIESHINSLIRSDKHQAISFIYDHYADALYTIILRIARSEKVAEDLIQDTFVKIWKNLDQYDSRKGRLYTWLLNIARNNAIDYIRSKRGKQDKSTQEINDTIVNNKNLTTSPQIDHIGVPELLNSLDEEYRVVLELIYFQGYTQREVEKELDITLGTVKSRLRIALNQLRKLVKVTNNTF